MTTNTIALRTSLKEMVFDGLTNNIGARKCGNCGNGHLQETRRSILEVRKEEKMAQISMCKVF